MLEKDLIKSEIEKCLLNQGYHLYDLAIFKREGELILAVEIDESLDLNSVGEVSEKISSLLDEIDQSDDRYILDVSSAGIEREIKDEEALKRAVSSYIHVDFKDKDSLEGDLVDYTNGELTIRYKDKNIEKTKVVKKDDLKKIRFAVKF